MLWTHPLLLAGLGALAVPVLIHLLMRAQGRKILFSTLRFLPRTKPARERKKIRHWPLLLLRLLILALLVGAFARPYWPMAAGSADSHRQPHTVLLLLDRSASMQAREVGGSRWQKALSVAGKVLDSLSESDRVAVVAVAQPADVLAPWGAPSAARRALANLVPTSEAGNLSDGLRLAAGLLEHAPGGAELVLISDLQKTSCRDLEKAAIPAGTRSDVRQVGSRETSNIEVVGARARGAGSTAITVDLHNYSSQPSSGLPVSCSLNQKLFYFGSINVPAGSTAHLLLPAITATSGWNTLQFRVATGDALVGDDLYNLAVFVPQPISVLVVEPHLEKRIFAQASYFMTSALRPGMVGDDSATSAAGPFQLSTTDLAGLPPLLAAQNRPSVLIVPPLTDVTDGLGETLAKYVRSGGGLLAWISGGVDSTAYNSQFSVFTPARLLQPEEFSGLSFEQGWRLGWWDQDSPLFGRIGATGQGDLTLPQFKERFQLEPDAEARVLASFEDKVPFLIEREVGSGRVLLVNASGDTHDSDWPIRKTYLPLLQRMTYFLAQRDPRDGFLLGPSLACDSHAEVELGAALANRSLHLLSPGGSVISLHTDQTGSARNVDLATPGCYTVRDAQNATVGILAVNFPPSESDLAAFSPAEISQQLRFTAPAVLKMSDVGIFQARHELWPWLLAGLLPLLLLEVGAANRIRT